MEFRWFILVLVTLSVWGIWGLVTRIASSAMGWRDTAAVAAIGHMLVALFFIVGSKAHVLPTGPVWIMALIAGSLGFIGATTFYMALDLNPSSIVVVATSLYPLVTLALSFLLLGEDISPRQAVGIALALTALVLISSE
ncbi:MAG: EamA family transporter [Candidatus Caldarchaeum sp.]|nr:EamA family transporter [Candidatus Caldarchaeum sp.]